MSKRESYGTLCSRLGVEFLSLHCTSGYVIKKWFTLMGFAYELHYFSFTKCLNPSSFLIRSISARTMFSTSAFICL